MYCLLLFGAAALGLGGIAHRRAYLGCRAISDYCWINNCSSGAACCSNGDYNGACQDPVETAVAFLNDCSIIGRYRGRKVYLQDKVCYHNKTYVLFAFDDGEHMAFELERGSCCPCDRSWRVVGYSYADI